MADDIDRANEYVERMREQLIKQHQGSVIPKGEPGECKTCGIHSERLVQGNCARCRDEFGLD
jgi:hypothetical protein